MLSTVSTFILTVNIQLLFIHMDFIKYGNLLALLKKEKQTIFSNAAKGLALITQVPSVLSAFFYKSITLITKKSMAHCLHLLAIDIGNLDVMF